MHLSKRVLYLAIIGYSVALLIMQDWGGMLGTTGTVSLAWLVKMGIDIAFVVMAGIRILGPALFAEDETDDEVAIHAEDLAFSDSALFGFFMLNVAGNLGWHIYQTVESTGANSFYYSLWTMAEAVALGLSWILWSHAQKVQRRLARTQRVNNNIRQAS